jgi:hypothetical protein
MIIQNKIYSTIRQFDNSIISKNNHLVYKNKILQIGNYLLSMVISRRSNLIRFSFICHLSFVICAFLISSCFSVKYTMSGASISPEVKTLSIQLFTDRSPSGQSMLSQQFTDNLREKCRRQTSLKIITEGGDVNFESEITCYDFQPTGIQSNYEPAKTRLTITIHVKYTNSIDTKLSYDTSFSRFQDYPSSENPDQVTSKLIPLIIDDLTEDIFNKAFVNW